MIQEVYKYNDAIKTVQRGNEYMNVINNITRLSGTTVSSIHIQLLAYLVGGTTSGHFFEIGTYTGLVPLVLASIYTDLKITTVDIPLDDPRNCIEYGSSPILIEAILKGRSRIASLPNTRLIIQSSQLLWKIIESVPPIDIAWVDGDHTGFAPYNDILFALMRLRNGGLILCDDVYINKPNDPTILALEQISKDIKIKVIAFQKRFNDYNKYVCCLYRTDDNTTAAIERLNILRDV